MSDSFFSEGMKSFFKSLDHPVTLRIPGCRNVGIDRAVPLTEREREPDRAGDEGFRSLYRLAGSIAFG